MAIRWIEIRLYVEGPLQSGYSRMVIQNFLQFMLISKVSKVKKKFTLKGPNLVFVLSESI